MLEDLRRHKQRDESGKRGLVDSWSLDDFIQHADGVDPSDYYVLTSDSGVQVQCETTTTGVTATKALRPVWAGWATMGGPPYGADAGNGDSRVEFNVIPGADYKVSICNDSSSYSTTCFIDLYPQYYQTSGALTTPTPAKWIYQAATLNGIANAFVIYTPDAPGFGNAFLGTWQYQ